MGWHLSYHPCSSLIDGISIAIEKVSNSIPDESINVISWTWPSINENLSVKDTATDLWLLINWHWANKSIQRHCSIVNYYEVAVTDVLFQQYTLERQWVYSIKHPKVSQKFSISNFHHIIVISHCTPAFIRLALPEKFRLERQMWQIPSRLPHGCPQIRNPMIIHTIVYFSFDTSGVKTYRIYGLPGTHERILRNKMMHCGIFV